MSGKATFAANANGYRRIFVKKNGSTYALSRTTTGNAGTVGTTIATAPMELRLVAGDYLELWAEQASGATLTLDLGESFLQASLVRTI